MKVSDRSDEATAEAAIQHGGGLRPPRFGLKALMWCVTAAAVLLAAFAYFGSHASAVLALLGLAIFAHVAGNAIGTRLRASSDQRVRDQLGAIGGRTGRKTSTADFAPATKLRKRTPLGRPIVAITGMGAVLGGVFGGIVFWRLMGQTATITSILLGMGAAAVLGGIWTFAAASFVQVAGGAMWQATRETTDRSVPVKNRARSGPPAGRRDE